MKIAIYTHNFPKSTIDRKDAGIFVYDFAQELAKEQQVFVFSQDSRKHLSTFARTKVYWFKWHSGSKLGGFSFLNPFDYLKYSISFLKSIRDSDHFYEKFNPNVNLAMWVFPSGLYCLYQKFRHKTPYIVWALGSDVYKYGKMPGVNLLFKLILINADERYADGIDLAKEVQKISGKSCKFVPSSSDLGGRKASLSKKPSKKHLVATFLGRLEKVKGPDILVDAILKDASLQKHFDFNILGDGKLLKELKAKSIHINNIKFYGNVSDKKVIFATLKNSDIVIIPSRSDSIPLVFSEAMKSGTPVVVASVYDLKYLVNKYKVGWVFKRESSRSLIKTLKSISKNKKNLALYRKNTSKASADFSIDASVAMFVKDIAH